jgi:hypothetical protein
MFGQYSDNPQSRRGKGVMLTQVEQAHGVTLDRKAVKVLARNTLDYTLPDGRRIVRLHDTDVVTIAPDGSITLDSGGWRTVTTKDRMNLALPSSWCVYSNRGWFVRTPKGEFPYSDGAQFKADGTPAHLARLERDAKQVAKDKALVAKFLKKAREKGWADPAGDPWVFSQPDRSVMMDWLRSGYFTARLCALAFEGQFSPLGVDMHLRKMASQGGKPDNYLSGKIRKYIYKSLGIA